MMLQISIKVVI